MMKKKKKAPSACSLYLIIFGLTKHTADFEGFVRSDFRTL